MGQPIPARDQLRLHSYRGPEIRNLRDHRRSRELAWSHSDDGVSGAVDFQHLPNSVRIAIEFPLPESKAQNDYRIHASRSIFLRAKRSPESSIDPKPGEIIC